MPAAAAHMCHIFHFMDALKFGWHKRILGGFINKILDKWITAIQRLTTIGIVNGLLKRT
jgi:hypothetical protein